MPKTLVQIIGDSLHLIATHTAWLLSALSSLGQRSPIRNEAFSLNGSCQQLCSVDERVWTVSIILLTQHCHQIQMPFTRLIQVNFESEQLESSAGIAVSRLPAPCFCSEAFS